MARWATWALLLLLLLCCTRLQAQTYRADASAQSATTFPWISTSGGTLVSLGDEAVSSAITIGFTFPFGPNNYTSLRIASNGMVQFSGTSTTGTNAALPLDGSSGKPNIGLVLLPLWDDLDPTIFGASVRYLVTGSSPNRVFTITWQDVGYRCNYYVLNSLTCSISGRAITLLLANKTTTFQVQLHEQGHFVYRYQAVDGNGGAHTSSDFINPAGALVGYELFNTDHVQYAYRSAVLPSGTTIAWRHNAPALVAGQRYSFESYDLSGQYIEQESPLTWMRSLSSASPSADRLGASFIARPGLADASCWSFESVSAPGRYLRHSSMRLQADAYTNTTLYLQDATFCARPGRASASDLTLAAYNYPGHYIRRLSDGTVGIEQPDGSGDYDARATFRVRTALADLPAQLLARWRMDEAGYTGAAGELRDTAGQASGPFHGQAQGSPLPTVASAAPPRSGTTGTCGYAQLAGPQTNGASFLVTGLPVATTTGARTSVAFWMYWTGGSSNMPIGFDQHALWLYGGAFGFNTNNWDVFGRSSAGLANTWVHVVAVFNHGSVAGNKLYVNGVLQTLSQQVGTPNLANALVGSSLTIGGYGSANVARFEGRLDEVQVFNGELSQAEVTALYNETHACTTLARVRIEHASGGGLTCTPNTLTVRACTDAACTTPYTSGLTGSLTATGGTVTWPAGAGFSIATGSSTTTVAMHLTSAGTTVLGTSGLSLAPSAGTSCSFGSPSCTFTAADAGLLFDVPDQLAETSVQVSVRAVKKADNSLACTPAFANVTRSVNFRCSYANPATGTLPVRIGGTPLNAGGSAAAACDATGRAVALAFDGTGTAATSAQYADVGRVSLTATYTGSGADAGLSMTGTDSFVAAPFDFAVSGLAGGAVAAGSATTATVTARNYLGTATPNFGRESPAESVTLGFVRKSPTGAGAVSGSFSGTVGSFANGVATSSNIAYTEVGQIDLVATLASSGYLGSAYRPAGASHGAMVWCADEWSTCNLPAGTVNTVWYANYANGAAFVQTGLSGSVGCTNAVFGDPWVGSGKGCWYVSTSGVNSGNTGALTLRPHRFDLAATAACPAGGFTYAGQPYTVTVTARNAAGGTTVNYDGSAATSPNQARAVTLADAGGLGLGTLSGHTVAASGFTAGVASASPVYTFTAKLTGPQSLVLRATDTQGTSSAGGTEPAMALRSGRLRLSNAFGKGGSSLQLPVTAEYWGGQSWAVNGADSCTTVPAASVALSNPRDAMGAATATTTSASSAVSLSAGRGLLSLAAPTPANASLTVDIALNLGSTAADQSCLGLHPASTGAARPWLRSHFGSCATTADRDPAARASFGVFSPETRKTVHMRELF